ncbi:uncharacterized protein BT62DRAFT_1034528 [Guyanagaster necrorhizus]|uniref:Uncharacterized protein n=1 Tax=Guyanagaster necrorhizus TaxID=856835 RepID=A0A9P7VMF4_9AGAR|nr:uncharacterized protein BT62DRAFT_1034528 [Guyanagaster necrorhizus MCA 3950]KAG7443200.1 hypothetical protein BT62DRAFT_1034528 [Guyanagaster necrorhizus MCA 3950]
MTMSLVLLVSLLTLVSAQTWCNKNYMSTEPIVPPGGEFPIPASSSTPLLALRCGPALRPYLAEDQYGVVDDPTAVSILVDAPTTFSYIVGASPITRALGSTLKVTVSTEGNILASGSVPLNATKHVLPFSLSALTPRTEAYNISCVGETEGGEQFATTALLSYLPAPPDDIGSVTKMDMRTGGLLARPAHQDGAYERVFPLGFYTQFDSYLAVNLSAIGILKEQGFNIIHPVPTFSNLTALDEVLDEMERLGMYLMYDMRATYMNSTSVTEQIDRIKSRSNLLLWYTADEPDGTSDPLNATVLSSNLITSLDGGDGQGGSGYHPVSLVLNCENYEFTAYASGADIVMQDTYMIGNNVTFSSEWGTVCTPDYGDCGCDNCKGNFQDISTREDEFRERIFINGWELSKVVWAVPQAFGNESYWKRFPTGKEFIVQSIVGINHGALGVVPWDDPTPADIKASASALALSLPKITAFILNPEVEFQQVMTADRIDVGLWTVGNETLVLATNLDYEEKVLFLAQVGIAELVAEQVLDSGSQVIVGDFSVTLESVGSAVFIVPSSK